MSERTDGAERGWRTLGKYKILAHGLYLNPYFTSHHIFLRGQCIGRQLSIPTESDCRWHEAQRGVYAKGSVRPYGFSNRFRPGRPSKALVAAREKAFTEEAA